MTIYFTLRHSGAVAWAQRCGIRFDVALPHLEIASIQAGDIVIGILPIHLAHAVCARGAQYYHLAVDLPPEARGQELSTEEMERYGARLERYDIHRCDSSGELTGSSSTRSTDPCAPR